MSRAVSYEHLVMLSKVGRIEEDIKLTIRDKIKGFGGMELNDVVLRKVKVSELGRIILLYDGHNSVLTSFWIGKREFQTEGSYTFR